MLASNGILWDLFTLLVPSRHTLVLALLWLVWLALATAAGYALFARRPADVQRPMGYGALLVRSGLSVLAAQLVVAVGFLAVGLLVSVVDVEGATGIASEFALTGWPLLWNRVAGALFLAAGMAGTFLLCHLLALRRPLPPTRRLPLSLLIAVAGGGALLPLHLLLQGLGL